eukprot:CAMPEP_0114150710 /NCGR_PEP_ID=MMETSP0043_2-20121206/22861_1 /TAXON_ID=464988 /ORGANISM="Hemiselmis andersenii, Strain CCMP644" /LENGTH=126 /DNA_ID=CAMNT_0001245485 /DNA_START=69 /DNA_END=446 /DNA_ORIENTATION=+
MRFILLILSILLLLLPPSTPAPAIPPSSGSTQNATDTPVPVIDVVEGSDLVGRLPNPTEVVLVQLLYTRSDGTFSTRVRYTLDGTPPSCDNGASQTDETFDSDSQPIAVCGNSATPTTLRAVGCHR